MGDPSRDSIALLETKLLIPRWRPGLVSRPRLIERLHQAIERKLTLVSAPAGFGKTTLLAESLADTPARELAAGWVSLDPSDNDPALFWAYFIAALQKVRVGVGERALSVLRSPQPPALESILTTLINEINAIGDDFALVLDDYHVIEDESIHSGMAFLLDHLPPRMHLVVASRSDPRLPLARLRARGELTELRAADLRFTPDEASAFLNRVMGLDVSPQEVAALERRTEGWIAGLQLAALSMQGREDVRGFIAAFSGDNRYVADYLVEEVLRRQPEPVRSFLLQTSILDRLTGPLCDAVTGEEGGEARLQALEERNLFVVPLDDERQWYRYHHLFADVLQAHAMREQPQRAPILHRRASAWYEHQGSPADAVRHALAAGDLERAAGLIELAWPAMERSQQYATWLGWMRALPDELVRARPVLSMGYAWALLNSGELEAGETRLRDAERWLDRPADRGERPEEPSAGMVVVDEEQFRSLPVEIATARAYLAQSLGDVPGTISYARRSLDLAPEGAHPARGPGAALLGLAHWASGELEAAHRTFAASMASLRAAGDLLSAIGGTFILGDIRVAQGRLCDAASTYERALHLAAEQLQPVFPGIEELHLGLSELHRERGDLEAAAQHLVTARELSERAERPGNRYRWCTAMARIEEARGDLDGALDLLDEAERRYIRTPLPNVRPVAALKTRIRVAQGRPAEALDWVRDRDLSVADDLSYLREFEHITLARVLLARPGADRVERSLHEALGLLERLLKAAEAGGRAGSVIEILVLQALAHRTLGKISRALDPLERALTLAEPEGYLRVFVDEGEPMHHLLRHAAAAGIAGPYSRRVLSAFDEPVESVSPASAVTGPALVRPLTEREVEVVRLIAAGMRNQEIADHLFISLFTVKRHIANAYAKLDVRHRTEAVARANALNLL